MKMSKTKTGKDPWGELVDLMCKEIDTMKKITEEQCRQSQSRENPDQALRYYLQGCIRGYDGAEAILYNAWLKLRKDKE